MSGPRFQFSVFEGPLDLLLHLIRKEEVDIYEVDMVKLATQFCDYVELMREFDLDIAGEFLVMASTLMYIKSKELLPVDQQVVSEEDEEDEDPRWELIRKLVEYRKFKDVAGDLRHMELEQEQIYRRIAAKPKIPASSNGGKERLEISLFDLLGAVDRVIKDFVTRQADTREIVEDRWTVGEKIEIIRSLIAKCESVSFSAFFEKAESRLEIIATFLALLELVRLRHLVAIQGASFTDIRIEKNTEDSIGEAEEEPAPPATGYLATAGGNIEKVPMRRQRDEMPLIPGLAGEPGEPDVPVHDQDEKPNPIISEEFSSPPLDKTVNLSVKGKSNQVLTQELGMRKQQNPPGKRIPAVPFNPDPDKNDSQEEPKSAEQDSKDFRDLPFTSPLPETGKPTGNASDAASDKATSALVDPSPSPRDVNPWPLLSLITGALLVLFWLVF